LHIPSFFIFSGARPHLIGGLALFCCPDRAF
jgi:hypothetical protein